MKTEDLVKAGPTQLASVPEYLKQNIGNRAGLEDVGRDDVLIPRLCIAQTNSPQVLKNDPKQIKGLAAGELFNSVTGENYGERVNLVPLFFFKQYIEFIPREQGGGIAAMYSTERDIPSGVTYRLDQCKKDEKPQVTEFKNEMCLLVKENGQFEPIVVSFKSTGMKIAKKWNALMRQLNLPAYARVYVLDITTEKNSDGTWFGTNVTPGSFVPEEFFAQAESYFGQLRDSGVRVDTAGLGDEATTSEPIPF